MKKIFWVIGVVILLFNTSIIHAQPLPQEKEVKKSELVDELSRVRDSLYLLSHDTALNSFQKDRVINIHQQVNDLLVKSHEPLEKTTINPKFGLIAIAVIILLLVLFLIAAYILRKSMLERADKEGEIGDMVTFLIKQTFGLPQGTVRGMMALVTAVLFFASVFYFGGEYLPESVKIITALVFGYYFSKSKDQSKELMDAMLGKTKQQALKKQEAQAAISEARASGSEEYAKEKLQQAKDALAIGESSASAGAAIPEYEKAIKLAQQARTEAVQNKVDKDKEEFKINKESFDQKYDEVNEDIGYLRELKLTHEPAYAILTSARTMFDEGLYEKAMHTLERAEDAIEVQLLDYEEAEKEFEKLPVEKQTMVKQELENTIADLDKTVAPKSGLSGQRIVESLVSIQEGVKRKDPAMVPLWKKRIKGDDIEGSEVAGLYDKIVRDKKRGLLTSALVGALEKNNLPFTEGINLLFKDVEKVGSIIKATDSLLDELFDRDWKQLIPNKDEFKAFVKKARKNLIDKTLEGITDQWLPEGVEFAEIKKILKESHEDKEGKGVQNIINKILDVGEYIVGFTPAAGIGKIAVTAIRGILKLFGRRKKRRRRRRNG